MATAFNLEGRLGLNITQFQNKLKSANANLNTARARFKRTGDKMAKSFKPVVDEVKKLSGMLGLGGALAGAVSAGGIALLADQSFKTAKQIQNLADTTGSTVGEIQTMNAAFGELGLEMDDVGDVFNTLADRAQDAKDGMQSYIDDFGLIGLAVDDLKGKRPAELFNTFADAVSKTEDPVRRNAAIVRILGDDLGRKLAPALIAGSGYFAKIALEAENAGVVMSAGTVKGAVDAGKALDRLKTIIQAGTTKAFAQLGPMISLVGERIVNFINSGVDFEKIFVSAILKGVKAVGFIMDAVNGLSVVWSGIKVAVFGFTSAFTGGINGLLTVMTGFANGVKDFITLPIRGALEIASKLPLVGDKFKAALDTINNFKIEPPQIAEDIFKSQLDGLAIATEEFKAKLAAPPPSEGLNKWFDELQTNIAKMKQAASVAEELRVAQAKTSAVVADGIADNTKQLEEFGKQMRTALGSSVSSALDGDFKSIENNFKNLLKKMIADAIAADIANAIGLGGAPQGGSTGGNFLSGALAFAGNAFGGFFANGGNPPVNKPAIVGERGPELIVPRSASTVIPNHALGGQGGNTYNITVQGASSPEAFRSSRGKIIQSLRGVA